MRAAKPPVQQAKWTLSTGVERTERETDHCHPSSVEFKNERSYIFTPLYALMASTWINIPFTIPHPHLSHYLFAKIMLTATLSKSVCHQAAMSVVSTCMVNKGTVSFFSRRTWKSNIKPYT
jgi:hypothetical protein